MATNSPVEQISTLLWSSKEINDVNYPKIQEILASITNPSERDEVKKIIEQATWTAKEDKSKLLASIESSNTLSYSFASIESWVKDLKGKFILKQYTKIIDGELQTALWENYTALSAEAKESIKIVVWNSVQSQFSVWWMASAGITAGTKKIQDIFSWFQKFFDTETWTENPKGTGVKAEVQELIDIARSMIQQQLGNLQWLVQIAKDNNLLKSSDFEGVLKNPKILESIVQKGKFAWNGIDIDVWAKKIVLATQSFEALSGDQKVYIAKVVKDSAGIGKRLEWFEWMGQKINSFAEKIWFAEELKGMLETLYQLPVIWIFFKIIFWGFFSGSGLEQMLSDLKDIKELDVRAVESFKIFSLSPLSKDVLWFKPSDKFTKDALKPFFETTSKLSLQPDIGSPNFWPALMTGKDALGKDITIAPGSHMEKLKKVFTEANLWRKDISEDDFIAGLNKLTIPTDSAEDAIKKAILEAKSFPINVKYSIEEGGKQVEKSLDIAFNEGNSSLTVNGKPYTFWEIKISGAAKPWITDKMSIQKFSFDASGSLSTEILIAKDNVALGLLDDKTLAWVWATKRVEWEKTFISLPLKKEDFSKLVLAIHQNPGKSPLDVSQIMKLLTFEIDLSLNATA